MNLTLHHYWRSSSSWRVRWALSYKKIEYKSIAVNLLDDETDKEPYRKINPMGFVPALEVAHESDRKILTESVAMIEWLEEIFPDPKLYPVNGIERAHCRALVETVNAGIQPVQNLTVLDKYSDDAEKRKQWAQYFISRGFSAYEKLIAQSAGKLSMGDHLTAADIFLIPQVYNALRNELNMSQFPRIEKIYRHALEMPSCKASHPDNFKDDFKPS